MLAYTWCDAVHKVTVQITEQLFRQTHFQKTIKQLKWSVLQKE